MVEEGRTPGATYSTVGKGRTLGATLPTALRPPVWLIRGAESLLDSAVRVVKEAESPHTWVFGEVVVSCPSPSSSSQVSFPNSDYQAGP